MVKARSGLTPSLFILLGCVEVLMRIFPMHFIRSLGIDTSLYCAVYSDQVGFLRDLLFVAENRQVVVFYAGQSNPTLKREDS